MDTRGPTPEPGVVVLIGGDEVRQARPWFGSARVIAADSGLDLAERLGITPALVVGDLDSVTPAALERAREAGIEIRTAPEDKDETDLELALGAAWEHLRGRSGTPLWVIGGAGGRLDHLVGNLAVMTGPRWRHFEITGWMGTSRVDVIRSSRRLTGQPGLPASILAWHGDAEGVTTAGLEWPLHRTTVPAGSGWGTSNRFVGEEATVSLIRGSLTVITHDLPEALWPREATR